MSQKHKKIILCTMAALFVVVSGVAYTYWWARIEQPVVQANNPSLRTVVAVEQPDATPVPVPVEPARPREIKVHMAGAVENAGLVTLPEGSRVADGIAAAGGASEDADLGRINLASFLHDAERFYVPRLGSPIQEEETASLHTAPAEQNNLININTATEHELQTLPGIGPVISGNIVRFREENGNFRSIEEIMRVPRVGDGIFTQIRGLITI